MTYQELGTFCKNYVAQLYAGRTDKFLIFHNLAHTCRVVERAEQILSYYQLPDRERFVVIAAALFHDVGYLYNDLVAHEDTGADVANKFLLSQDVDEEDIVEVLGCILATSLPQHPTGLLQSIVCDADLFHLGTSDFFPRDALMLSETEVRKGIKIAPRAWIESTIELMENHHFHTQYCKMLLDGPKGTNLEKLKIKLEQMTE